MDKHEFEQFVTEHGKDILRFCRMNAGSTERGNELYQDTMVKLLEKKKKLDAAQNIKSYAMQTAILLWKNKKKKYAVRNRILPESSLEEYMEQGGLSGACEDEKNARAADVRSGGNRGSSGSCGSTSGEVPDAGLPEFFRRNDHAGDCGMLTYPVKYRKNPDAQSKSIVKRTIGGDRI